MTQSAMWGMAWRLLRHQRGRLWLFLFCVAVGSAARVSVGSFMHRLDDTIRRDARVLLAADLEISDDKPLRPSRLEELQRLLPAGSKTLQRVSLLTMAGSAKEQGRSRLCQLSAVEAGFPFFGQYSIEGPQGPDDLALLQGEKPTAVVASALLPQLNLKIGDWLRIGSKQFRIGGIIHKEPGLGSGVMSLGPSVLVGLKHLQGAGLTDMGSRARHETLVALPSARQAPDTAEKLRAAWQSEEGQRRWRSRAGRDDGIRIRTHEDAQDEIKRFFEELAQFLNLVSLMALLLGGVGVASVTRGFISEQAETIGIYRVLGASGKVMTRVYFLQCLGLGLVGGLIGAFLGSAAQMILPVLLGSFLPVDVSWAPVPSAMLWGPALGMAVASLFGLLPVSEILATRPAQLFQQGLEGARAPRSAWLAAGLGFVGMMALAVWEADSFRDGAGFIAALACGAALLWASARFILPRLAGLRFQQSGFVLRFGISNLWRPGRRGTSSVVALGCSALLLGILAVYQHSLLWELDPRKEEGELPSLFFVDVQNDQVDQVRNLLDKMDAQKFRFSPMVRGRLKGVEEDDRGRGRSRERNLSYRHQMGIGETLVKGRWFDPQSSLVEASLEQKWAKDRGVDLGDTLLFDIQGVLIEAKITSLRRVHWASFQPNFFVLLSPWALQDAPKIWVGAVNGLSDEKREAIQNEVARQFPTITQIDVAQGVGKVMGAMQNISLTIRFIALFALAAGLVVLAGIALASARERRAESALLKTLGGRRRQLVAALGLEFGLLGLISGLLGIVLALLSGWILMVWVIEIPLSIPWPELSLLLASMVLLCSATGIAVCWRVFGVKPLAALRQE